VPRFLHSAKADLENEIDNSSFPPTVPSAQIEIQKPRGLTHFYSFLMGDKLHPQAIPHVRSRLISYFVTRNALDGNFHGSYNKLPDSAMRKLALDVVTILSRSTDNHDDGLETAVDQAVTNTPEAAYWAHLRSSSLALYGFWCT
jgi:hypothetical protein